MPAESSSSQQAHIAEDIAFEQRWWFWQKIGWAVIAAILLAALLGLFGPGLLGESAAGEKASELWISYSRFGRLQSESTNTLRIHIGPVGRQSAGSGTVRLWLDRKYLEAFEVRDVQPEPENVELQPERMIYTFRIANLAQPATIIFKLEPDELGTLHARVGLESGPALEFKQFIYP